MNNERAYYPLTYPQKGIWYTEKMYPGTSICNIAGTVKIFGKVDCVLLEKAINILIERNDSLRIRITIHDDEPAQYISPYEYKHIDFFDFSNDGLNSMYKWEEKETPKPFQIIESDLFYFAILKINNTDYRFYIKTHHLVSDAWTMNSIVNQVMDNYTKLVEGKSISSEKKPSYIEYINRENDYKSSKKFIKDKIFWDKVFEDMPEISTLKTQDENLKSTAAERKPFIIPGNLAARINDFCLSNKISIFTFFLSFLAVYIHRITFKDDIVIGTPVLNRSNYREKDMLGMFISTIPIRIQIDSTMDITSFIKKLSKEWFVFLKHHEYPYELLIKDIRSKHKGVKNLYDVILSYQNAKLIKEGCIHSFEGRWHFSGYQKDSLYIHINDREADGNLIMDYDFVTQYFTSEDIENIHKRLLVILQDAMENPQKKIYELEIMDAEEKKNVLYKFNNSEADYPKGKTINRLFEEQVERTPDSIAVIFEDKRLTYRELNSKANKLARELRRMGVGPESIVAVMLRRSLEMVIGIIGVLKAGGAYLPLDPDYPEERLSFMMDDSNVEVLLTHSDIKKDFAFKGKRILINQQDTSMISDSNLPDVNDANHLIYVIYTSGSTGKPKGVMLEHRSVANFIKGVKDKIDFSPGKTILSATTICFDIFVLETLLPLTSGLKVVIANENEQKIPRMLSKAILRNNVTMFQTTPSLMQLLLNDADGSSCLKNLSELMIGGEAFPQKMLERLKEITEAKIYNMYGPTETTVWSTIKDLTKSCKISIGTPIANTQIYILDKCLNPVPIGIIGDMYIGGDGLARGYLNRLELTRDRFIENPFISGKKVYKTGDVARWLPEGEIECLGRSDNQVKIRGLRIELEEIENHILKHPSVKEAVVIDREDSKGTKYLCAYVVLNSEVELSEIRNYLTGKLPIYMVPSYFIVIDKIPLTQNGKVNRKVLPEPSVDCYRIDDYVPPSNAIEVKLCDMWSEILNIDRIGINDNILELGGDSLTIISIASLIYKEFSIEISIEDIYRRPTINALGSFIEKAKRNEFLPITVIERKKYYQLSSAQKRLYILSQLENNNTVNNIPWVMAVDGSIDVNKLESVLKRLIARHESLRTGFTIFNGTPVQEVFDITDFKVEYYRAKEEEIEGIVEKFIRPFDLGTPPLLRAGLIELSKKRYILMLDMHHIISDGASLNILLKELVDIYNGKELPDLKVQYKDYSEWQRQLIKTETVRKQKDYWLKVFSDEIPVLNLPYDYQRPPIQDFVGDRVSFRANKELTAKLKKLSLSTGTTLYMLLLAAYNILLAKYSGQEDIIIGSPVAGRNHFDLEGMVGVFINTVAMRNKPVGRKTFTEFLSEVKENSIKAFSNQDYPFEELVGRLKLIRDLSRNPLFDTMFILQSSGLTELETYDFKLKAYEFKHNVSKFDLLLGAVEEKDEILFVFDYCTKLFNRDTVERFANHFLNILIRVTENPDLKLMNIDLLSEEERCQLLFEFNRTKTGFPCDKTVHQLFEEQVERAPEKTAIVFEDKELTYRELNEKSNQLARLLREKGVKSNSIVGIMINRSLEMIIGIMGIIKSGGSYLPIDPDFPENRIKYILNDSKVDIVINNSSLKPKVYTDSNVILIDEIKNSDFSTKNLENINKPEDLIYVIYTSGSTGNPKGVMLTHRSVINFIKGVTDKIGFSSNKTIISLTTISFDIFVLETLLPLVKGLKCVIANEDQQKQPKLLSEAIIRNKVDMLQITPSRLQLLIEYEDFFNCLKLLSEIMVGGEAFPQQLLDKLKKLTKARVYNMYGPTETTVWSTIKDLTVCEKVNIGSGIANTQLYILNADLNPVPIGVPGDLYIGGEGLATGYLNNPELTDERFIPNPFIENERIYKTGDIARWLNNGDIECLGRIDHQVKIMGHRIELEEIENKLLEIECVKEAVVTVRRSKKSTPYLCAYIVLSPNREISAKELRDYLLKNLPVYMVPTSYSFINNIPQTPNGKIDRKFLSEFEVEMINETCILKPANEVEDKLLKICSEVLNIGEIGVNSNLFELGADSLSIIMIQIKTFQYNWGLTTQDFYRYQTIRELSEMIIEKMEESNDSRIDAVDNATDDFQKTVDDTSVVNNKESPIGSVLLTGATGFLGIHILCDLLSYTDLNIYCLMRDEYKEVSEERLKGMLNYYFNGKYKELINERVFIVNGDITQERFGLQNNKYEALGQTVDIVIHAAAKVDHFGVYSDYERVNVLGTGNVIDFSLKYNKLLYHISTMSVSGTYIVDKEKVKTIFTEKDFYIGQNYKDNVYVRSKFEAERLIFNAVKSGLKAVILRVGNLTGRYSDGLFQINMDKNAFYNRIRSIIELRALPNEILEHSVEFTPVDCCSSAIVKTIMCNRPVPRVLHLFNNNCISLTDFINILTSLGICIETMDSRSYADYVEGISKDKSKQKALMGIIQDFNGGRELEYSSSIVTDSHITREFLRKLGFHWPHIGTKYIHDIVDSITKKYLIMNN